MAEHTLRVDHYSHHFRISEYGQEVRQALRAYARTLAQYGPIRGPGGSVLSVMKCVFIGILGDRTQFTFLKHQQTEVYQFLSASGFPERQYLEVTHEVPESAAVEFTLRDEVEHREYQVPIISYLTAPGYSKMVELQTGKGKSSPLNALVRIPGGWSTMGEMQVGTTVTAKDGTPTQVTAVYPQGIIGVYNVTFADGRSVECSAKHLWKVYDVNTVKHLRWRVVDTVELLRLISMPHPLVYVPLIDPEDHPDTELPVHPYLLGTLLGDGCMTRTLHGASSHHTCIPEAYLEGSLHQRWELLQGLMDTDGTANTQETGSATSYRTSSYELALGVQYLVRSLGGIAKITSSIPHDPYQGETLQGRLAYDVNIRVKTPSLLFTLPEKKERTHDQNQDAEGLKLQVKSVEFIGEKACQCIAIDHPEHLYVTNEFTVTHNSHIAMSAAYVIKRRTMLFIKPMYIEKWKIDILKMFDMDPKDLMVISGSKNLKRLIELAQAGELTAKIIIISNATLRNYLVDHELFNGKMNSYGCFPWDFYQTCGVGLRITDEVHQDFHLNYRIDSYTHIEKTIALSATMDSDDPFLNRRYEVMFPMDDRAPKVEYDKYIAVEALFYEMVTMERLRFKNFFKMYNHTIFEQSLMKNTRRINNYQAMVGNVVRFDFAKVHKPGMKCAVYFATIEMCTLMQAYLSELLPDLDVRRYVGEDPYENLMECDIACTTMQSAGTAVDIPNLAVNIMTVAISSKQANIQGLGRLRRLKDFPDFVPKFVYLVCTSIPKHLSYHKEKMRKFNGLVLSHSELQTNFRI